MKILYVTSYYKPAYTYGGPTRSIPALCQALVKQGVQVTVFTTNANGSSRLAVPLSQPVDVDGVIVWYFPLVLNGLRFFYSPGLTSTLKAQSGKFDLVVAESLWGHALKPVATVCNQDNIPYIVPLRGQLLPWSFRQKQLKKQIYLSLFGRRYLSGAAALHCTDPGEAEAVARLKLGAPIFVVPNGVDTFRFAHLPTRGRLRQRLDIPLDAKVLLFLGRLHRKKRPDIAIDTLAATQPSDGQTYLVMAGPDEEQLAPMLQSQAQRLGCADRVRFAGLLKGDDVLLALADADLLLMPSEPNSENFGMSAVEAMASGLPILVSDGVPVGRWAEEAGAGRMVPCTPEAFAQAAVEMLSTPEALKEMGKRGQEFVRQRFDISSVAWQMLAQFEAIIETGRPLPT